MSCWQKTKLVGPLVLFNILLPTWDVFSDVKLSVDLIMGGNQSCSREDENVHAFRQELELCLQNPQEYCQNGSVAASYLCQVNSTKTPCLKCSSLSFSLFGLTDTRTDDCLNTNNGIREVYNQCLDNGDYCSDPNTYHGICEEVTRRHYKFAILIIGIHL